MRHWPSSKAEEGRPQTQPMAAAATATAAAAERWDRLSGSARPVQPPGEARHAEDADGS